MLTSSSPIIFQQLVLSLQFYKPLSLPPRSPSTFSLPIPTIILFSHFLFSTAMSARESAGASSSASASNELDDLPERQSIVPHQTQILIQLKKLEYNSIRKYDGTFDRSEAEKVDLKVTSNANPDVDGVYSTDHIIDRNTCLLSRVYRLAPENEPQWTYKISQQLESLSTTHNVPVILFFHGGSFCHSSPNTIFYDVFCRSLVRFCKAVVVSASYRRSPEHQYPYAYVDGLAALKWVKSRTWLRSGTTESKNSKVHVFLAGDSSGGNIAHHVAVQAAEENIEVIGNILIYPLFGGEKRMESEIKMDDKYYVSLEARDWYWRAFLPEGENRDHPACNPFGPRGKSIAGLKFPKTLVCVPSLDPLRDWHMEYVEGLKSSGHDVQVLYLENAVIGFCFLPDDHHYYRLREEINNFIHSNMMRQ